MKRERRHSESGRARRGGAALRCALRSAARSLACLLMAFVLVLGPVPLIVFAQFDPAFADDGAGEDGQYELDLEAARAVDDMIAGLPQQITVDDRSLLESIQAAYDGLTPSQQALVTRKGELDAAFEALAQAEAQASEQERIDAAAAGAVDDLIAALPAPENITRDSEAQVTAALDAYNALTPDQQALVTRKGELDAAVSALTAAMDEPEKHYVETLMLKWDKPDDSGETHFVGDSAFERSYKQITITEFGEQVQLRGWYTSTDGTGVVYQTANDETPIGSFGVSWSSSDNAVASVGPDGLVTPHGKNGSVTINATVADPNVFQGSAPTCSVVIKFDGQEGKYVKKVEILDEKGDVIGAGWGGVTSYDEKNTFHQLHARVTWHNVIDNTESIEVTGSGDSYDASQVGTTLTWSVSASDAFTINANTGRLKTGQYSGNAFVTCTAVGGLGGKAVTDSANVQLDTGVYQYNPTDSLTLKVVWEERPDEVVKEKTYSVDELSSLLSSRHVNATVVNHDRFGVISAEGYLFKDVVKLVAVDDNDVLQFRFGTADGYDNPVSYKYLFDSGPRYYFPNYDIGSRAEGEVVAPILAYKSAFKWSQSEVDPSWTLDEGTRFRLVFGCLASGDANTSFQIYYINTITIVLKGAPSVKEEKGSKSGSSSNPTSPSPSSSSKSAKKGAKKSGQGSGTAGSGTGVNGTGGGNGTGPAPAVAGDGRQAAGAQGEADVEEGESGEDEASGDSGNTADPAKRWRVYQMMNKNNSDVPDWDDENPLSPFAMPIAVGTFAVGAGATGIGFRRRLK